MKDKILEKALALYNENGIEYVGMRELANSLNIKLGNITYYFPKKEDLVYEIWYKLSISNTKIIKSFNISTLEDYYKFCNQYFNNQYLYRCLYWSFTHSIYQNPKISKNYKDYIAQRNNVLPEIVDLLILNGYIKDLSIDEKKNLGKIKTMIFRHWIVEAKIVNPNLPLQALKSNYIELLFDLLNPFYTPKGIKSLKEIKSKYFGN